MKRGAIASLGRLLLLLLLVFAVVVTAYWIFSLMTPPTLRVNLPAAVGLSEGMPVFVGHEVAGRISGVEATARGVEAEVTLIRRVEFREGAEGLLRPTRVPNPPVLDLDPGPVGAPPMGDGAVIEGRIRYGDAGGPLDPPMAIP